FRGSLMNWVQALRFKSDNSKAKYIGQEKFDKNPFTPKIDQLLLGSPGASPTALGRKIAFRSRFLYSDEQIYYVANTLVAHLSDSSEKRA
ncbi:MAG: hypothetical protein K0U59_12055, partial [Gammaproteobacteria bacterium]|nr:hypothetical protein [Gammaproteobacteria bacterium]